MNQRMHCKFEDVDSGRTLEVSLGFNNGKMLEEQVKEKESKVSSMTVS